MLKGVEQVTIIDSFVVNKDDFLAAYKISPELERYSLITIISNHKATNRVLFINRIAEQTILQ